MKKDFWSKSKRRKKQYWKVDTNFGIFGDNEKRGHIVASGAIIVDGQSEGGKIYYNRDIDGNILVNKNEKGHDIPLKNE